MSLESETVTSLRKYYKELLVFQNNSKVEHVIEDTTVQKKKFYTTEYEMNYRLNELINYEIHELEKLLTVIDKI